MNISKNYDILAADISEKYAYAAASLIEILHDVQAELGFIPAEILSPLAKSLNVTRAEIHGVVSFYDDFKTSAPSNTKLRICRGEACQAMGARGLYEEADAIANGKDMDVEAVYCLGNCALAPAAQINSTLVGRVKKADLARLIKGEKP